MITETQRQQRTKYIGSSDAAAICGLDPNRSAADVWLEKTGRAEPFAGNAHTERGNLLEPAIVAWAQTQLGDLWFPETVVHANGVLAVNLDAAVVGKPEGVEAKSSVLSESWGEPMTDAIPDNYIAQTQLAMFVADLSVMWVPVLLPGFKSFDFRMYRVERSDKLADAIAARCVEFWEKYVVTDTRPDEFKPSLDVLARIRREPNKTVPLSANTLDAFVVLRAARMQAEEREAEAKAKLLAELGDAEQGECRDGRKVRYMETKRAGYTVEPTAFRQLRVIKPAKEKRS